MSILPSIIAMGAYLLMPEDSSEGAAVRTRPSGLPACAGAIKTCFWCAAAALAGVGLGSLS